MTTTQQSKAPWSRRASSCSSETISYVENSTGRVARTAAQP